MKTTTENHTKDEFQKVPFHVTDSKGRTMGCLIETREFDRVHAADDAVSYSVDRETGHYFHATIQATRDGKRYGASQQGESFTGPAQRDEYIKRRVAASRKAAEQKAAK